MIDNTAVLFFGSFHFIITIFSSISSSYYYHKLIIPPLHSGFQLAITRSYIIGHFHHFFHSVLDASISSISPDLVLKRACFAHLRSAI